MRHRIYDSKYHFLTFFDDQTGAYLRTGILKDGKDTGVDPFMASFPHLIDVGIMGHCAHGKSGLCAKAGIGCYQNGRTVEAPNMALEDFAGIVRQCAGKVNQFALGGRGDPDMHEHFGEILALCREHHIVPNFTTSGFGLTEEHAALCARYCGAVAVSWYRSSYTLDAIRMLLAAGVRTNIHYVLGRNSIDEALDRLEHNTFPAGINAVVFLLHKPVGQGSRENVLDPDDPRLARFFALLDHNTLPYKLGLDSCTIPGVVNHCANLELAALDTCEGARFSCYISADLVMLPCSFDQERRYGVSLRDHSIQEAWDSPQFDAFRAPLRAACPTCPQREVCMGGCPLKPEIVLCRRSQRTT